MNTISIYTDESGSFASAITEAFVFAGLILFSEEERQELEKAYLITEETIRFEHNRSIDKEIKAFNSGPSTNRQFLDILSSVWKFALVIPQKSKPALHMPSRQARERLLQYAYRLLIHSFLRALTKDLGFRKIVPNEEKHLLSINLDMRTTQENIEMLRNDFIEDVETGFLCKQTKVVWPNVIPNIVDIELQQLDSKETPLIRAADFIAHYVYNQEIGHWSKPTVPNLLIFKFKDVVNRAQQIQKEYTKWKNEQQKASLNGPQTLITKIVLTPRQLSTPLIGMYVNGCPSIPETQITTYEKIPLPLGELIIPTWKFNMPMHNISAWKDLREKGGWNF